MRVKLFTNSGQSKENDESHCQIAVNQTSTQTFGCGKDYLLNGLYLLQSVLFKTTNSVQERLVLFLSLDVFCYRSTRRKGNYPELQKEPRQFTFSCGQDHFLLCVHILQLVRVETLQLALQTHIDAGQVLQSWGRHFDLKRERGERLSSLIIYSHLSTTTVCNINKKRTVMDGEKCQLCWRTGKMCEVTYVAD